MRGFSPRSSHSCLSATSIASADHGSTCASAASAAREDPLVEQRGVGLDFVEQEPGEGGELVEPPDLLLDDRGRGVDALGRPVEPLLAHPQDEPVGVIA